MRAFVTCPVIAVLALALGAGPAAAAPTCSPPYYAPVVSTGGSIAFQVTCRDDQPWDPAPALSLVADPAVPATVTVGPPTDRDFPFTISASASATPGSYHLSFTITGASEQGSFSLAFSIRKPDPPTCEYTNPEIVKPGSFFDLFHGCKTQPDGLTTAVDVTVPPAHGTVTQPDSSNLRYTPAPGFEGTDRFSYRPRDGATVGPQFTMTMIVTNASAAKVAFAYAFRYCVKLPPQSSCNPGYLRHTPGGGDKVSHRSWPKIGGIFFWFPHGGGGRLRGGPHSDELLGHHGSDTVIGLGGRDVIWGDWEAKDNNTTQVDVLDGGPGRDAIYTSHGHNTVRGGAGNDLIWAFYGKGTVDCGPGIDKVRIRKGAGNYRLRGCERTGTF